MFSNVSIVNLGKPNAWKKVAAADWTAVAVSADDNSVYGGHITLTDRDQRYLVVATNTAESGTASVSVKAGNAFQSNGKDATVSLAAGDVAYIQVESGMFKVVTADAAAGTNVSDGNTMDKVFIATDSDDVKLCVLHLVL